MSKFIKDAAKGVGKIGSAAVKSAVSAVLTEIAGELLKETGAADLAKDKIMEAGMKVIETSGMDVKNLQKDILKNMIMKELNL